VELRVSREFGVANMTIRLCTWPSALWPAPKRLVCLLSSAW
jgi:hypothetical protein